MRIPTPTSSETLGESEFRFAKKHFVSYMPLASEGLRLFLLSWFLGCCFQGIIADCMAVDHTLLEMRLRLRSESILNPFHLERAIIPVKII